MGRRGFLTYECLRYLGQIFVLRPHLEEGRRQLQASQAARLEDQGVCLEHPSGQQKETDVAGVRPAVRGDLVVKLLALVGDPGRKSLMEA